MANVTATGSGTQQLIKFPSGQITQGQPGANLNAFLSSLQCSFGFGLTPHQFNLVFVPDGPTFQYHGASGELPSINTELTFDIGSFLIKGIVTHAEYNSAIGGTLVNISMSDKRRTLRQVNVTTDDLGPVRPSGTVSVAAELRELYGFNTGIARDVNTREYQKVLEIGATYSEIYTALQKAYDENRIAVDPAKLPTPTVIAANLGANDAAALRFRFGMQGLDEVVDRVMQDSAYDWYWKMSDDSVGVVNRKQSFSISESSLFDLLGSQDAAPTFKFGQDAVSEPSRVRLLGARKQGIMNSPLLSPIDGVDLQVSGINFIPAWNNITVQFIDAQGLLRSYKPSNTELQCALAGIEQWTYYKLYQTASSTANPPGFGLTADAGSIAAQHPEFQSRLDPTNPLSSILGNPSGNFRVINNRRDAQDNWVIAFFNRVSDHAQRHFGRSYVASGILYNSTSGYFRVVDAAWANVENQVEGQSLSQAGASGDFKQGYILNKNLGPISPFIQRDFRVSAFAVMPSNTLYGPLGEDVPTSFGGWSEDVPPFSTSGTYNHYIPVSLGEVGQKIRDPRDNSDVYGFQAYPEGTVWCQFPTMISSGLASGTVIDTLATIVEQVNNSQSSGELDVLAPNLLVQPLTIVTGVAVPIEVQERYGDGFPQTWVSGTLHPQIGEQTIINEEFAPWNFFPVGTETSVEIMDTRALRTIQGLFIDALNSRFAEVSQTGFPVVNFDNFATQIADSNGNYGVRSNGISTLSLNYGIDGISTTYKINDFFGAYGRIPQLGDRIFPAFQGPVNPIDFDIFNFDTTPSRTVPLPPPTSVFLKAQESFRKRVTITEVTNVIADYELGSGDIDPERYFGKDDNGQEFPNRANRNGPGKRIMSDGVECIDGFLNVDDPAVFHYEKQGLTSNNQVTYNYFTGGHNLGTTATVSSQDATDQYTIEYEDEVGGSSSSARRSLKNVGPMNAGDSVTVGSRVRLVQRKTNLTDVNKNFNMGTADIYIQSTSSAGVSTPVQITDVVFPGSPSAVCTVQEVDFDGTVVGSGTTYYNVLPIPFRSSAAVGMRGTSYVANVPSGTVGQRANVRFIHLPIHPPGRFS